MTSGEVDNSVVPEAISREDSSSSAAAAAAAAVTVIKAPAYPIPPSRCHCELSDKLEEKDPLVIKEATTGYTENGQESSGNFVTYVIEFGVS